MGVPERDHPQLKRWCGYRAALSWGRPDPADQVDIATNIAAYRTYLKDLVDAKAQAMEHWERIEGLGVERVTAVEASPAFTEPGPQLVDGVELLCHLLHPELMDAPGNTLFVPLSAPVSSPAPDA